MKIFRFCRSEAGYGWHLWIGPRIRIESPGALTPMWPHVYRGGDEYCNDTVNLHLWPLFGVGLWWRGRQRTATDGLCDACLTERDELAEQGIGVSDE